jgi:hypothetical protein
MTLAIALHLKNKGMSIGFTQFLDMFQGKMMLKQ